MKVAILTKPWKNSIGTGMKTYIVNLVDELAKNKNIDVSVIYIDGEDSSNYKVKGHRFLFPIKAFFHLKHIKPDVIHTHASWYLLFTGFIYKLFWDAKLVTTMHSHPSKLSLFEKKFMGFLFNNCDVITYVSKDLKNKIHDAWKIDFKAKEEITYGGVEKKYVSDEEITKFCNQYCIKKDSIILLAQSFPIAKVKSEGAKILMNAVKIVSVNYPNISLIITGIGPYKEELESFADLNNLNDIVIFTGWVDNPFIPLEICDIYSHISLGEGLPMAILEAMSVGKPIIATPVGGIPEVISSGESGLLVEPDANKIAESILYCIENEEIAMGLGKKAKFIVDKNFTWNLSANKFVEIFISK
jgi:glycosyltransferase involved in cell wall biosynthesis